MKDLREVRGVTRKEQSQKRQNKGGITNCTNYNKSDWPPKQNGRQQYGKTAGWKARVEREKSRESRRKRKKDYEAILKRRGVRGCKLKELIKDNKID